jgi:hypothetical protein
VIPYALNPVRMEHV